MESSFKIYNQVYQILDIIKKNNKKEKYRGELENSIIESANRLLQKIKSVNYSFEYLKFDYSWKNIKISEEEFDIKVEEFENKIKQIRDEMIALEKALDVIYPESPGYTFLHTNNISLEMWESIRKIFPPHLYNKTNCINKDNTYEHGGIYYMFISKVAGEVRYNICSREERHSWIYEVHLGKNINFVRIMVQYIEKNDYAYFEIV